MCKHRKFCILFFILVSFSFRKKETLQIIRHILKCKAICLAPRTDKVVGDAERPKCCAIRV